MGDSDKSVCLACGSATRQQCSRCKVVKVCSQKCLTQLWPTHKWVCRAGGAPLQRVIHDRSNGALCVVWTSERGRGLAVTRDTCMGTVVARSKGFVMSAAIVSVVEQSDALGPGFWKTAKGPMAAEFALAEFLDKGPEGQCAFVANAMPMQSMLEAHASEEFRVFALPLALANHECQPSAVVSLSVDPVSLPAPLDVHVEGSPAFKQGANTLLLSRPNSCGGRADVTLTLAKDLPRGAEVTLSYVTCPTRQQCRAALDWWGVGRIPCTCTLDRGRALFELLISVGFDPARALTLTGKACGEHGHVTTVQLVVRALAVAPVTCAFSVPLHDRAVFQAQVLRHVKPFQYLLACEAVKRSVAIDRGHRLRLARANRNVFDG